MKFSMQAFIKTQAALIVGSLADFCTTFLLVDILHCWYIAGSAAGNITGAAFQFLLSSQWVFVNNGKNTKLRLTRFIVMWLGSLILFAIGVYVLTHYVGLYYLLSKLIVSVLLGTTYTYLLSKKFVFV